MIRCEYLQSLRIGIVSAPVLCGSLHQVQRGLTFQGVAGWDQLIFKKMLKKTNTHKELPSSPVRGHGTIEVRLTVVCR